MIGVMSVLDTTKHSSAIILALGNKVILCSNNNSSLLQGHDHTSDIPTGSSHSISLKKQTNKKLIKPSLLLLEKCKAHLTSSI